jgi:hypothetical protein
VFKGQAGGASLLAWTSSAAWTAAALTLQNLVFDSGQSVGNSNFVDLQGTGTNNIAFGSLTFKDCTFQNIRVSNTIRGGLISVSAQADVALTFIDSAFLNIAPLVAGGLGSAIVWGPVAATSSFKIRGPTTTAANPTALFQNCRSKRGGAISLQGIWGQLVDIQDTTFKQNVADEAGGALSTISSLPSSASNALSLFGCVFISNVQGSAQTASDSVNLGGGALALSQGSVTISGNGPSSTTPCSFSGNGFGTTAFTALASRGGTAIRVTAMSVDQDAAPITALQVSNCAFSNNQATMLFTNGSPLFVIGDGSEFATSMPVFANNSFIGNGVLDPSISAGGIFYQNNDVRPAQLQSSILSSTGAVYDLIVASGSMVFGPSGATNIGRINAGPSVRLTIQSNSNVTLIPPLQTNSVFLGNGASLSNEGTLIFAENSEVNGPTATMTSSGTMIVSRNVTMTTPLTLTSTSVLIFLVRSSTDYGVLTIVNGPIVVDGQLVITGEGSYVPSATDQFTVVRAGSVTGSFASSLCPSGSACTLVSTATGVAAVNTAPPPTSTTNVGAIVGGVIGGIVVLALIVLLIVFLFHRKRKQVRENVALPNPAFEGSTTAGNDTPPITAKGNVSPKATERPRTGTLSGDPTANATLNRLAATSPSGSSTTAM